MKSSPQLLVAVILTGAAAALVYTKQIKQEAVDQESLGINAAFREGKYQGKSDAEVGKAPHVTSGRWSADSDRGAFVSGYKSGYEEIEDSASGVEPASPTPAWIGFRDGIADGIQRRQHAQLFQSGKTEKYLRGDHGYSAGEGNQNQYQAAYRDAYSNGYQPGYYGDADFSSSTVTAPR